MTERIVGATVHGRYLAIPAETDAAAPMLVGFHGYGEDCAQQLERLRVIPGSNKWLCVSIQALSRFYERRFNRIVACWMTSQDRERAISDNRAYVARCIEDAASEWSSQPYIVFAGFSQGAAMAWRAAVHSKVRPAGVISVGGDIPPELTAAELARIPAVLIVRAASDLMYSQSMFDNDLRRLHETPAAIRTLEFEGRHEWSGEIMPAASEFLQSIRGCGHPPGAGIDTV